MPNPLGWFSAKKPDDPPDGPAEARQPDGGGEAASGETQGSSEQRQSTKTAEQQVNPVEATAQPVPSAQPAAPAEAEPGQANQVPVEYRSYLGPLDVRYPVNGIIINHDNHGQGRGEDAPPLWRFGLVGAFDGLGGAGGELVKVRIGREVREQTGAWVASRIVRNQVDMVYNKYRALQAGAAPLSDGLDFYDEATPPLEPYEEFDFTVELRRAIQVNLDEWAKRSRDGGGVSRLKSKLIKTLPTTLAACTYDLEQHQFNAIWAGDSRVFYLRPDTGLLQVTTDDLRTQADALKNLTEDSPMSNCVSADSDFVLHERRHELQPFSILLAATDGCFGYVQTPLHFEHLLLASMQEAADWTDWARRLLAGILQVTGDDSTLSAAAIGWRDFKDCQERFRARAGWCADRVRAYDEAYGRVRQLEGELDQARKALTQTKSTLWEEYRRTYEIPAESVTRNVPDRQQPRRAEPEPSGTDRSPGADRP